MMPSVQESVDIAATPSAVFKFVADQPERATTFIPGLNRISNVSPEAAGVGRPGSSSSTGSAWSCPGTAAARVRATDGDEFKTVTGNPSPWTYRFEPAGPGTTLMLTVDYDLPQNQLARFAAAGVLEPMNRNRAREIVANLKAQIEP
jgi:hypothetical protein